jgi:hypothetical protein
MHRPSSRLALAAGLIFFGFSGAWQGTAGAAEPVFITNPVTDQTAQATSAPPVYVPPRRGGPSDVAPAATRSGPTRQKVKVLGPDHTGLTISAQPTLYMYVGETGRMQLLLTRVSDRAAPPVASGRIEVAQAPTIVSLPLSSLNATLEQGVEYRLTVMALDKSGSIRASDAVQIMHIAAPAELAAATAAGTSQAHARVYAGAGVWYDAIHALGKEVAATPSNLSARSDRAALLEQAGMHEVASYDRRLANRS